MKKLASIRAAAAFTLVELLLAMSIVCVLVVLILGMMSVGRDRAAATRDMSQIRQIVAAVIAHAGTNDGYFYSKQDVGNSLYRSVKDPLGLPQLLSRAGVLTDMRIWLNPNGRQELIPHGNSYAWAVNDKQYAGRPMSVVTETYKIIVLWDNYSYISPSPRNVQEASTSPGPTMVRKQYWKHPFEGGTASHFGYLDGHVELKVIK